MVYATDPTSRLLAENIQAQWKKNLNAAVAIDNLEWKVFLARLNADAPQIYRLGWGPTIRTRTTSWPCGRRGAGTTGRGGRMRRTTASSRAGRRSRNRKRRKAIYDEAQRILLEQEAPIVPVYFSASNRLIHPRVRRFPANPLDLWILKRVSLESQ